MKTSSNLKPKWKKMEFPHRKLGEMDMLVHSPPVCLTSDESNYEDPKVSNDVNKPYGWNLKYDGNVKMHGIQRHWQKKQYKMLYSKHNF